MEPEGAGRRVCCERGHVLSRRVSFRGEAVPIKRRKGQRDLEGRDRSTLCSSQKKLARPHKGRRTDALERNPKIRRIYPGRVDQDEKGVKMRGRWRPFFFEGPLPHWS